MMQGPATPPRTAQAGIFDSGVGGLTVAAAIRRLMPALPVLYIADTAYFPYGDRPESEVTARALALSAQLIEAGCNLIVVACNTASSAALEAVRARFDVPIVGMEPPLKPAAERTRSGRVLVLATPSTARGERLQRLHREHGGDAQIETVPMPGLADLVEAGEVDSPRVESALANALAGPLAAGTDEIALGCTHYGFLRPALAKLVPAGVEVLDAAEPVARRVRQQFEAHGLTVPEGEAQPLRCLPTGDRAAFAATIERLRAAGADLPRTLIMDRVEVA
jgi:glutamate racemase